jgi:glycosyltransferase involved in cell wall biosynthesis
VIIRARDEAASIGRCLELIREQRLGHEPPEVIVVDSGSRDTTPEIARRQGASVVTIPESAFTFGRALNLGAANARGELLVALSADAFAPDPGWLARLCEPFADARVACACGATRGPDDRPLTRRIVQDEELVERWPEWGYSNGAGAFRAALWRARPFRADLPGCEDKEWAWHWLHRGYVCVVDPTLASDHDHTHDSLSSTYRRASREARGFAGFLDVPHYGPRELARDWWTGRGWHRSPLRARASPRRLARLLGAYAGRRTAR